MQQDFFKMINEFNKQAYDASRTLADINSRTFSRLGDKQESPLNVYLDGAVKQAELARDAKDTGSYFKEQAELTKQYGEKVVKTLRESLDVVTGARDEYAQWTEQSVNEAASNLKQVQEKAERATRKAA